MKEGECGEDYQEKLNRWEHIDEGGMVEAQKGHSNQECMMLK